MTATQAPKTPGDSPAGDDDRKDRDDVPETPPDEPPPTPIEDPPADGDPPGPMVVQ